MCYDRKKDRGAPYYPEPKCVSETMWLLFACGRHLFGNRGRS